MSIRNLYGAGNVAFFELQVIPEIIHSTAYKQVGVLQCSATGRSHKLAVYGVVRPDSTVHLAPLLAHLTTRTGPSGALYAPTAGEAGSGRRKRLRKRSTADLSPSILRLPERSASARSRPS